MTAGEAFLSLLANTVSARRHPREAFAAFDRAVDAATRVKGVRGEADDLVRAFMTANPAANRPRKAIPTDATNGGVNAGRGAVATGRARDGG